MRNSKIYKFICCFSAAFLLVTVNAIAAQRMYVGFWNVGGVGKTTLLVQPALKSEELFRLSCTELVDSQYATYRIYADNRSYIATIGEAGSSFVKAKEISIEQVSAGQPNHCTWEILGKETTPQYFNQWFAPPNVQTLLATFTENTQFVLNFSTDSLTCDPGSMQVMVDNNFILDNNGNPQIFMEGSGIVGYGKTISVITTGICRNDGRYGGEIAIEK